MRTAASVILSLVLAASAQAQEPEAKPDWGQWQSRGPMLDLVLRVAVPVAIGADLVTTERALARPGTTEANPLQQNRAIRAASHAAAAYGVDWLAERWIRKGERAKARWLRVAVIAGYTALAIRNEGVGK